MAGPDDDVTQRVGATALGVAWARAAESRRPDALFHDPYAALFLEAAQARGWNVPTGATAERIRSIGDYAASRTVWFDDFFADAAVAGVRQAVILGAGLDARAYRLDWADGTTVYEIDRPDVLRFKAETLAAQGATPSASACVAVAVDLGEDWPTALVSAGFDPSMPTAWASEGLLLYLPAAGQDQLFERITALSAPDSQMAVEAFGRDFFDPEHLAARRDQVGRLRAESAAGDEAPDIEELWFPEDRADVSGWLATHGWQVSSTTWRELLKRYRDGATQNAPRTVYVTGAYQSTSSS